MEPNDYGYDNGKRPKKPGAGPGIASLIMGLIALILFLAFINIPIAIVAIILAIVGIAGYEKRGASILGLIFSVASIVMGIGSWALMLGNENMGSVAEDFYRGEGMQEYYNLMESYGITINPDTGEISTVPPAGNTDDTNNTNDTNDSDDIIGDIEEL